MIKEIIGASSTFFVLLPFLLINSSLVKIKKSGSRRFLFFLVNIIQIIFIAILAYSLYFVGERTLYGLVLVLSIFLFLQLVILLIKRKRYDNESEEEDFELFSQTQKLGGSEVRQEYEDKSLESEEDKVQLEETKQPLKKEREEIILEESFHTYEAEEQVKKVDTNKEVVETLEDIFRKR